MTKQEILDLIELIKTTKPDPGMDFMVESKPEFALSLCERLLGLQEALECYADPDKWEVPGRMKSLVGWTSDYVAREALAKFGVK